MTDETFTPIGQAEMLRWEGWTIPEGYVPDTIATCRGCRTAILWCITPRGKRSPHDRDGTSHFATCPEAARFRR